MMSNPRCVNCGHDKESHWSNGTCLMTVKFNPCPCVGYKESVFDSTGKQRLSIPDNVHVRLMNSRCSMCGGFHVGYSNFIFCNNTDCPEFLVPLDTFPVSLTSDRAPIVLQAYSADPRFDALLHEIAELYDKKSKDYGVDEGPLANVRASATFNVPPWLGAIIRLNDKITRIGSFARKGTLANESLEDSIIDIAVYSLIALQLYREDK